MSFYLVRDYKRKSKKESRCNFTSASLDCLIKSKWQFSSYLVNKGFNVVEVGNDERFTDGNIQKVSPDTEHIYLRACAKGQPIKNGNRVEVNNKQYMIL